MIRQTVRRTSDWVDLSWSYIVADLQAVAALSRGQMLDVGCGDKPYEPFFSSLYLRVHRRRARATFSETTASQRRGPDVLYDGRSLPFPDSQFETVMSVQVLEHRGAPAVYRRNFGSYVATKRAADPECAVLSQIARGAARLLPVHALRAARDARAGRAGGNRGSGTRGLFSLLAHKVNTFLAFRVGRLDGLSQALGKLAYEEPSAAAPRYWVMHAILPAMLVFSACARVFDRAFPEGTEALSFLVLAGKPGAREAHDEATRWSTAR
jgi:hypothetical protein